MKLKLALQLSDHGCRDLVATIDPSTTVGELAGYLARADLGRADACATVLSGPLKPAPATGHPAVDALVHAGADDGVDGDLTLALVDQNHRALDPRLTVPDSGLRSGSTVAVTRCPGSVPARGRPVAVGAIVAGPDSGKDFPLWPGTAYIGRGQGAEIRLGDSSVSRRHAKLVVSAPPGLVQVTPADLRPARERGQLRGTSRGDQVSRHGRGRHGRHRRVGRQTARGA